MCSGLASLTQHARSFDAGDARQTVVEMDSGYLCCAAIDGSSPFALAATGDTDLVAYEMTMLTSRMSRQMIPRPTNPLDVRGA